MKTSKPTWDPYKQSIELVKEMSEDDLKTYIFNRFTGRESNPAYDWGKNQESSEDFLIWTHGVGDPTYKKRLENCLCEMVDEYLDKQINQPSVESKYVLSRLLYLSEIIKAKCVLPSIYKYIVEETGLLNRNTACLLSQANDIPWGETLLHQILGTQITLEYICERKAPIVFWSTIANGGVSIDLPGSIVPVAIRGMGSVDWLFTVEIWLDTYIGFLLTQLTDETRHRTKRNLSNMINFFLQESVRQKTKDPSSKTPSLFEDPTPLINGFWSFVNNDDIVALFNIYLIIRKSLGMIANYRQDGEMWLFLIY